MKILINTTFTPYNTATVVKPTALLWTFRNSGHREVIVNNAYTIKVFETFGIDKTDLYVSKIKLALKGKPANLQITDDTTYSISFGDYYSLFNANFPEQRVVLLETNFQIIK